MDFIAKITDHSYMLACGKCEGVFGYNDSVEILLPWSFPVSMMHKKWNPKNYDKALKKYDRYLSERKEEE